MPKVSKLVSSKLEKYFNDKRMEQSFDVSLPKLQKGSDKDLAALQQQYFEAMASIELEKRRFYLRNYRTMMRKQDEQFLNSLGKENPKMDGENGSEDGAKTPRSLTFEEDDTDDNNTEPKKDSDGKANEAKSVKSTHSKRTAFTDAKSLDSIAKRYKILPEISVPVEKGKIKPKLVEFSRRKVPFSEADRIVHNASDVFSETELKEIKRIYRYRERDHGLLPPLKVNNSPREEKNAKKTGKPDCADSRMKIRLAKTGKPDYADSRMKIRLALHPGTILKAPQLCRDADRILEMTEKGRKVEPEDQTDDDEEERSVVDLEGKFKEPLPKGAGDCNHLALLLGIDEEAEKSETKTLSKTASYASLQSAAIIEVEDHEYKEQQLDETLQQDSSIFLISPQMENSPEEEDNGRDDGVKQVDSVEATQLNEKSEDEKKSNIDDVNSVSQTSSSKTPEGSSSEAEQAADTPRARDEEENVSEGEVEKVSEETTKDESVMDGNKGVVQVGGEEESRPTQSEVDISFATSPANQPEVREDENSSPMLPSERGTPFTEKNEADVDTENEEVKGSRKGRLSSRRERDEKFPNLQRSSSSSSTATSRASSRMERVELTHSVGDSERSPIAMSGDPESEIVSSKENEEGADLDFFIAPSEKPSNTEQADADAVQMQSKVETDEESANLHPQKS